jgi:hypothetical protein
MGAEESFASTPGALVSSLAHDDLRSSSASDLTMSLSVASRAVPPHVAPMMAQPGVDPQVALQLSLLIRQYGSAPPAFPQVVIPPTAALPPAAPAACSCEPLKLWELKDAKVFIDNYDLIQYYLRVPDFSMGRTDDALITDSSNFEASQMWEGQLCLSVKDGSLCYLFENKGDQYKGRGFEMLAALTHLCHPNSVGVVHANVGQKLLICYPFKSFLW